MVFTKYLLVSLLTICLTVSEKDVKVIIVAMSGLRHDALDGGGLPTFQLFKDQGIWAKKMKTAFITNSFPSLWTIATGLWPEDHGILDNNMYDPELDDVFHGEIGGVSTDWYASEPIWITAEKQGIRTAISGWPGANLRMDGMQAKYHPYVEKEPLERTESRVKELVDWMVQDCDLGFILFPQPDNIEHRKGINSAETLEILRQNDDLLKQLSDWLDQGGIANITNIIIVGDHGMTEHDSNSVIYLSDMDVRLQHLGWVTGSLFTSGMLFPHDQYFDRVYKNLTSGHPSMTVYKKEDIPDELHIKNHRRCAPILLIPEEGYRIEVVRPHADLEYDEKLLGMHGYLNTLSSMQTTMLVKGPSFRQAELQTFDSINIYPMVCSLLGLNKCHGSPGDMQVTQTITKEGKPLSDVRGPKVDYYKLNPGKNYLSASSTRCTINAMVYLSMIVSVLSLAA